MKKKKRTKCIYPCYAIIAFDWIRSCLLFTTEHVFIVIDVSLFYGKILFLYFNFSYFFFSLASLYCILVDSFLGYIIKCRTETCLCLFNEILYVHFLFLVLLCFHCDVNCKWNHERRIHCNWLCEKKKKRNKIYCQKC